MVISFANGRELNVSDNAAGLTETTCVAALAGISMATASVIALPTMGSRSTPCGDSVIPAPMAYFLKVRL
jgi:hypothetical protein